MSESNIDSELKAIRTLLSTLEPLEKEARKRVIDYVFQRLDISHKTNVIKQPSATEESLSANLAFKQTSENIKSIPKDIRSLAKEKNPSNDVERATLVAFYLSELAIEPEKKDEINFEDITKYFKQAGFPIPSRPRQVLVNTKNAGYIDSAGNRGTYKINPVGYNLVAYTLPSSGSGSKVTRKKSKKKLKANKQKKSK